MDLCFDHCLVFFHSAVDLPYQRFELGVYHEQHINLLVVVLELYCVLGSFVLLGLFSCPMQTLPNAGTDCPRFDKLTNVAKMPSTTQPEPLFDHASISLIT